MNRPFPLAAALAVLLVLVLAPGAAPAASTSIPVPEDDPFYRVPANAASLANGAVIASRRVDARAFELPLPVTAWQVKYRTEDSKGGPSASVTTVLVPPQAWTGPAPGRCSPTRPPRTGSPGGARRRTPCAPGSPAGSPGPTPRPASSRWRSPAAGP